MNQKTSEQKNNLLWRGIGVGLLIIPFIPLLEIYGELRGYDYPFTPLQWVSASAIALVFAWLFASVLPIAERFRKISSLATSRSRSVIIVLLLALGAILVFAQFKVFKFHPLLVDSVIQLFQAKIFASGHLVAPLPKLYGFFMTQHMVLTDTAWASQYPPGHSALLAVGIILGAPWLVGIILSIGTAYLIYRITDQIYDRGTALVALTLTVASPFFFFMGASFMNHVSAIFFIALFALFFINWEARRDSLSLALAGMALGSAFLSRPFTAIAIGVPFLLFSLPYLFQSKRIGMYLLGLVGFLALAGLNLWFNGVVTGDPFTPGYVKLWGAEHGIGFHTSPWGDSHTPATGLRNQLINLSLLNEYLFESPLPGLVALGLFLVLASRLSLWDRRFLISFLALPFAYFFYWHRDSYLGPRFVYEGLVFCIPLIARALTIAVRTEDKYRFQIPKLFKPVSLAELTLSLCLVSFIYMISFGVCQRYRVYSTSLESFKRDLPALAQAQGIEEGLVFIPVSWGNRIIANLRELGVSASLTQQAYKFVDHCILDELWKRAREQRTDIAALNSELTALISKKMVLQQMKVNDDPTLKLRPDVRPTDSCIDEIQYDGAGYTVYTPHLPSNAPKLDGALVYATDLRSRNRELAALYPGKRTYILRGDRFLEMDL